MVSISSIIFFCDCIPFISLLCSNTHEVEVIIRFYATFDLISSLLVVLVSYLFILITILRMKSAAGRCKAFSTCGSHLTVVSLFYGAILGIYMHPSSTYTVQDTVATVIFTVVTPMVNPFIYSLRNRDVKGALRKLMCRRLTSSRFYN